MISMKPNLLRYPLILLSFLSLMGALWGGLIRLGWVFPGRISWVAFHGPLMVCGFLGILVSLERAQALQRPWAFLAPGFAALGMVSLILGAPQIAAALFCASSLVLVAIFVWVLKRQLSLFTFVMIAGALCWGMGNLLWALGWPIPRLVFWWVGFLVLTIAGERLELSRFRILSTRSQFCFGCIIAFFLMGLLATLFHLRAGTLLLGIDLLALMSWLYTQDIALKTVKHPGLPRYIALCLLSGYFWLGVGGVLLIAFGQSSPGPAYDAWLHSLFLGFVFSMIFGHAPMILPAVLNVRIAFRQRFYLPLILLHLTLILRITGDLLSSSPLRKWAGGGNVIVLLLFFVQMRLSGGRDRRE